MLHSTLIPVILLSLTGELKPLTSVEKAGAEGLNCQMPDEAITQSFEGTDSHLKAPVRMRITDEPSWQKFWLRHHNIQVIQGSNPHPVPRIDFSKHMVVAVVERSARFRDGIQAECIDVGTSRKGSLVTFDYAPRRNPRSSPVRPENVYRFFVIPRYQSPLVIRRSSRNGWKVVARMDALASVPPSHITVAAKQPSEHQASRPVLSTRDPASVPSCPEPSSVTVSRRDPAPKSLLNIGFAFDPYQGNYDGVAGSPGDVWNFVDIGTTAIDYLRHADATGSTARLRITRHDGEWAIKGHSGIFKGYIYHNCQCVDLEATLLDLSPARYRAYVYAHGDAPNQNANIEILVDDRSVGQKATINDGTWSFREQDFKEGVQFVRFDFDVQRGETVRIISRRDGSDYSMFNAIQLVPIAEKRSASSDPDEDPSSERSLCD